MKNIAKGTLHFVELFALVLAAVATGSVAIGAVVALPSLVVASKLMNDITGNEIKDSIFSVYKNGQIKQNSLAHPIKFMSLALNKNKSEVFVDEATNMFMQLKEFKSNGQEMTYKTKSQPMTLFLLRTLEKEGYIKNLTYEKAGKHRLLFEKISIGNKPDLKKKYQMYKMSFNVTDKKRDKEELKSLIQGKKVEKKENSIIKAEKEENEAVKVISQNEVTKEQLEKIKRQLQIYKTIKISENNTLEEEKVYHTTR